MRGIPAEWVPNSQCARSVVAVDVGAQGTVCSYSKPTMSAAACQTVAIKETPSIITAVYQHHQTATAADIVHQLINSLHEIARVAYLG